MRRKSPSEHNLSGVACKQSPGFFRVFQGFQGLLATLIEEQPADDCSYWEQTREYPELDDDEDGILNRLLEIM